MKYPELRQLAEYGRIKRVTVDYLPMYQGWSVTVRYETHDGPQSALLERQRGDIRIFKTCDAALKALKSLGITTITVLTRNMPT